MCIDIGRITTVGVLGAPVLITVIIAHFPVRSRGL
jgi:hypothetical protein